MRKHYLTIVLTAAVLLTAACGKEAANNNDVTPQNEAVHSGNIQSGVNGSGDATLFDVQTQNDAETVEEVRQEDVERGLRKLPVPEGFKFIEADEDEGLYILAEKHHVSDFNGTCDYILRRRDDSTVKQITLEKYVVGTDMFGSNYCPGVLFVENNGEKQILIITGKYVDWYDYGEFPWSGVDLQDYDTYNIEGTAYWCYPIEVTGYLFDLDFNEIKKVSMGTTDLESIQIHHNEYVGKQKLIALRNGYLGMQYWETERYDSQLNYYPDPFFVWDERVGWSDNSEFYKTFSEELNKFGISYDEAKDINFMDGWTSLKYNMCKYDGYVLSIDRYGHIYDFMTWDDLTNITESIYYNIQTVNFSEDGKIVKFDWDAYYAANDYEVEYFIWEDIYEMYNPGENARIEVVKNVNLCDHPNNGSYCPMRGHVLDVLYVYEGDTLVKQYTRPYSMDDKHLLMFDDDLGKWIVKDNDWNTVNELEEDAIQWFFKLDMNDNHIYDDLDHFDHLFKVKALDYTSEIINLNTFGSTEDYYNALVEMGYIDRAFNAGIVHHEEYLYSLYPDERIEIVKYEYYEADGSLHCIPSLIHPYKGYIEEVYTCW